MDTTPAIQSAMASDGGLGPVEYRSALIRAANRNLHFQFAQANGDSRSLLREITTRGTRGGPIIGPDGKLVQFSAPVDSTVIPNRLRRQMRKGNPLIKAALAAAKSPIQHAFSVWRIESDNQKVRAFLRAALEPVLSDMVNSALLSLDFGHAPHEKVFHRRDVNAPTESLTFKNAIVLKKVKPLEPDFVQYYVHADTKLDENGDGFAAGDFAGFKHNNRDQEFVPAEKAWVVTNEKEFDIITGTSVLDAAYPPYYWWTVNTLFMNRYLERRGTPYIKAFAPNRVVTKDGVSKAGPEIIGDQLELLTDGGICVLPSEFDERGKPLWDISFLEDQGRGDQFLMWIDQCSVYLMLAILIPDSVLMTPRREGSRALAEVRERVFDKISTLRVTTLEEHISRFIFPQLIELNRDLLGISPEDQLPTAIIKAQIRPTDRQELLLGLLEALVKAKDAPAAQKTLAMIAIQEVLAELGIPLSVDAMRGIDVEIPTPVEPTTTNSTASA